MISSKAGSQLPTVLSSSVPKLAKSGISLVGPLRSPCQGCSVTFLDRLCSLALVHQKPVEDSAVASPRTAPPVCSHCLHDGLDLDAQPGRLLLASRPKQKPQQATLSCKPCTHELHSLPLFFAVILAWKHLSSIAERNYFPDVHMNQDHCVKLTCCYTERVFAPLSAHVPGYMPSFPRHGTGS